MRKAIEPPKGGWPSVAGSVCADSSLGPCAWLDGAGEGSWLGVTPDIRWSGDEWRLLERVDEAWRAEPDMVWIGWLTFDVAAARVRERRAPVGQGGVAGIEFRRYPAVAHWRSEASPEDSYLLGHVSAVAELEQMLARPRARIEAAWPWATPRASWTESDYRARVRDVLAALKRGDSYQVNLSQRFDLDWSVAPSQADIARWTCAGYLNLRERAPAQLGALIEVDDSRWWVSNSPETLVEIERMALPARDIAYCRPIKGTIAHDADHNEQACATLWASEKDRAEHLMIVDLMRNDLGKLAHPGTVRAPVAPEMMRLPTVNHLVTEIRCELHRDWTLSELFGALCPGGSVTGAPKRRTLELIEDLERETRGIYCGAICILHPGGLQASIPIRTGTASVRGLEVRSGGGIVMDSHPEVERLETLTKLAAFVPQP